MICANMIAFGKAPSSAKPYKARLEYLESTGTQYIDTGWSPMSNAEMDLDLQVVTFSDGSCGVNKLNNRGLFYVNFWNDKVYPRFGSGYPSGIALGYDRHILSFHNYEFCVDGEAEYTATAEAMSTLDANTMNFHLFACLDGTVTGFVKIKVFDFKAYDGNILAKHLIPVLDKAGVACMYDEVSGEFFYNQGEGEFVAGPVVDDVEYTAKDYVQDGLAGFYDSIENLGPGLSDNSGSFKEWVSGYIVSSLKGIVFDSSHTPVVMDALAGTGKTIEICVKNVAFDSTSSLQRNLIATSSVGQTSFQIRKSSVRYAYVLLDGTDFPTMPLSDFFSATFSITRNESAMNFAQNGSTVTSKEISSTPSSFTRFETMKDDSVVTYELCRVSIYNRALTAEEIAYNYSIDKARFNLP